MRFLFYAILLCILSSSVLISQNKIDTTANYTIDSIVVNAVRYSIPLLETPYSIDVIDKSSLLNVTNTLSMKEVLQSNPGVFVNNRFNFAQDNKITIRGIGTRAQFGVRGVKIFLDGIPLTVTDGQSQLNNIDIQTIDKIEIVKGPSSVIYGNSLGGAILIQSNISKNNNLTVKPEISFGEYGFRKYSIKAGGSLLKNNFSIGAYSAETDGFREHSKAKYYGINFLSNINISENINIAFTSNYYNSPYLLNPSSLNKFDAENNPTSVRSSVKRFATGKKVQQFQNGLSLNINIDDQSKIKTSVYGITRTLKNSIPGRIIELDRFFGGLRIEYTNKFNLFNREIFILSGIDYEEQTDMRSEFESGGLNDYSLLDPTNLFNDIKYEDQIIKQEEKVKSLGFFSHINIKISERINLFAGARYDDYLFNVNDELYLNVNNASDKINMNNFSGMLGFSTKIKNNITLFGNYSNGFQTPTTNELSNNPFGISGFNTKLKPEISNNYELGIKGWSHIPNTYLTLSIYKMDISNMLIPYQSETEEIYYRNAGSASNYGIETKLETKLNNSIGLTAAYSFMSFRYTDYKINEEVNGELKDFQLADNYLPGIPKHNISFSTEYNLPFGLVSQLHFSWTDKYFTNDRNGSISLIRGELNDYINDSYALFNLNFIYRHKIEIAEFVLKFKIENLFDLRYNDSIIPNAFGNNFFEPAVGRTIYFNLSLLL